MQQFKDLLRYVRTRQEDLNESLLGNLQTIEEGMAQEAARQEAAAQATLNASVAVTAREQALFTREAALKRREDNAAQVHELAATRLAANKTLREQLAAAQAETAAARKELSDLKSMLNNLKHPAGAAKAAAELVQAVAEK